MEGWLPLRQRPLRALRLQALTYRSMAATARTAEVAMALRRLAARFDALADRREHEELGQVACGGED